MTLKKKLALAVLLLLVAPLALFNLVNLVKGYLPPSNLRLKAPFQFEEAFNERMAVYGMSLDLDSANYGYGNGHVVKTVPVQCADGGDITCTFYATSDRKKALILRIRFEEKIPEGAREENHLVALGEAILSIFESNMLDNPQKDTFQKNSSYNDVMRECAAVASGALEEYQAWINPLDGDTNGIFFQHTQQDQIHLYTVLLRIID